jgi:type IV pilus assembly protein PilO
MPIDLNAYIKKNPKQLTMAMIAAALAALLLFVYFLLMPQLTKLGTLVGKASKAKLEFRSAKVSISNIDKFKSDISKFSAKIDLYEKKLPAEQEMPSLLEELNSMAKKSNLDIISITPSAPRAEGALKAAYQEFQIKIIARCGYHELGSFLTDLENTDRFMKLVDINIKANENTPKMHSVELMVATYILLKDKEK